MRLRLAAVKQFAKWLGAEGYLDADAILLIRPPKLDQKPVRGPDRRRAAPTDQGVRGHRRGATSGTRRWCCCCATPGCGPASCWPWTSPTSTWWPASASVRRGKGGRSPPLEVLRDHGGGHRPLPAGRARAPPAARCGRGETVGSSYTGLTNALRQRAAQAGVKGFHVHRLRHSGGGALAGRRRHRGRADGAGRVEATAPCWTATSATAREQLAAEEFDRLALDGD